MHIVTSAHAANITCPELVSGACLVQGAMQTSGCPKMSLIELNRILMGLTVGIDKLVGCYEFVAASISPLKMRRRGCFLKVSLLWS